MGMMTGELYQVMNLETPVNKKSRTCMGSGLECRNAVSSHHRGGEHARSGGLSGGGDIVIRELNFLFHWRDYITLMVDFQVWRASLPICFPLGRTPRRDNNRRIAASEVKAKGQEVEN